jgi:hypothetical protein
MELAGMNKGWSNPEQEGKHFLVSVRHARVDIVKPSSLKNLASRLQHWASFDVIPMRRSLVGLVLMTHLADWRYSGNVSSEDYRVRSCHQLEWLKAFVCCPV